MLDRRRLRGEEVDGAHHVDWRVARVLVVHLELDHLSRRERVRDAVRQDDRVVGALGDRDRRDHAARIECAGERLAVHARGLLGRVLVVLVDDQVVRTAAELVVQRVNLDLGRVRQAHPYALRALVSGPDRERSPGERVLLALEHGRVVHRRVVAATTVVASAGEQRARTEREQQMAHGDLPQGARTVPAAPDSEQSHLSAGVSASCASRCSRAGGAGRRRCAGPRYEPRPPR